MKTIISDTLKSDVEPFDKTIEKCAAVITKYPGSRYVDDALFMMGVAYYFKGDYARALEKLEFLLTNFPGSKLYDDAMYYTGLAYYKTGNFSKAIIAFKEAAQFKKFSKKANVMLCYAYYCDRNHRELINIANFLLKQKLTRKEKIMILNILGESAYALKDYESALKSFNEIENLEQSPAEKKKIKLMIASIYLEMERYEECKNFLEAESDFEFRMLLAELNVKMNDLETAKQIYHEIKEIQSSEYMAEAYYKLAQIAESQDSLELAVAYYDSLIPKASSEISSKAKTRSEILKKILELTKKTEEIDKAKFSLAELYLIEVKDISKAIEYYESVYKNYPMSSLSPKALYANFWIYKMILRQDSIAQSLAAELIKRYPETEYVKSVKNLMGK
ncbi:MAG: tetratricopeptide repeat protein [candidate division WOR-3 bacterium]